jgi:hypothetical protein
MRLPNDVLKTQDWIAEAGEVGRQQPPFIGERGHQRPVLERG